MRKTVLAALLAAAPCARAAKITELAIPTAGAQPMGIAVGADGRVWFTEHAVDKIGAATPGGTITEYTLPGGTGPLFIAAGPKRALVFTSDANKLGLIDAVNGSSSLSYTGYESMIDIAAGPDGRVWIPQYNAAKIAGIHYLANSPASSASSTPTALSAPYGVAVGPDKWIWYTESAANRVGVCAPYNASLCSDWAIPTAGAEPRHLAVGPDGNVWFTEFFGDRIARVTSAGVVTEFPIPTPGGAPLGIAAGPDGALWFTEFYGNRIGRVTTAGDVTEYPVPTAAARPYAICKGPDGRLWFTEYAAGKLGRVDVVVKGDANGDGMVAVADVFFLINFLFAGGAAPQ